MPGKPLDPQRSPEPVPESEQSQTPSAGAGERTGPVSVTRHLKDDGRALILYSRADDDLDASGPVATAERE